ncbi:MAG: hypothetical protein R3F13_10915 [Prosthecobacter sp.]
MAGVLPSILAPKERGWMETGPAVPGGGFPAFVGDPSRQASFHALRAALDAVQSVCHP